MEQPLNFKSFAERRRFNKMRDMKVLKRISEEMRLHLATPEEVKEAELRKEKKDDSHD